MLEAELRSPARDQQQELVPEPGRVPEPVAKQSPALDRRQERVPEPGWALEPVAKLERQKNRLPGFVLGVSLELTLRLMPESRQSLRPCFRVQPP